MKQLYSSFALLLVVAVVGGWIYFNERGPIATEGNTILLRSEPSQVKNLVLQRPDGKRVTLTRAGKDWRVQREGVNTVAVPADNEIVQTLLDATRLIQSAAVLPNVETTKLKEYGLARPQSTLVVNDAKIEFGTKPSFDVNSVYARFTGGHGSDSRIALVPATLADFAAKPLEDWRDKDVLGIDVISVSKLDLNTPLTRATFERTAIGGENELDEWEVKTPLQARADAGTIVTLLQEIKQTKATQFLEDNPRDLSRWGLDKPFVSLDLLTKDGPRTLRLGKKIGHGRAAQNSFSSAVFVIPETFMPVVNRPLRDWRDKTILRFEKSEVQTLRVRARGQSAEFQNDASNLETPWKRLDKITTLAAEPKNASRNVLDISLALDALKAIDFVDKPQAANAYGLDKPALEIDLTSNQWNGEIELQFGAKNGIEYARVGNAGKFGAPIYRVASGTIRSFDVALDALFPIQKKTKR